VGLLNARACGFRFRGPPAPAGADGLDADGGAAQLDPVAAYQFTFAVPTLDSDATLAFTVDLTTQTIGDREVLLRAVDDGSATLALKGDTAGGQYEAVPVCATGGDPGRRVDHSPPSPSSRGCLRPQTKIATRVPTPPVPRNPPNQGAPLTAA